MDCKHLIELNATTGKYDGEIDLDYCCDICDRSVPEESVVHITKTQHQLMQDVVKGVRNTFDGYVTGRNAAPQAMAMIGQFLDALDKGE